MPLRPPSASLRWKRPLSRQPHFPPFLGLLQRLLDFLHRHNLAFDVFKGRPDLFAYPNLTKLRWSGDPFGEAEPWMNKHFCFDVCDERFGDYGLAYKQIISAQMDNRVFLAYAIKDLLNRPEGCVVFGVSRDITALFRETFGAPEAGQLRQGVELRVLISALHIFLMFAFSFFWIIRRTRLKTPPRQDFFLGIDIVSDPRLELIADELNDAPEPIMFVSRSETAFCEEQNQFKDQKLK